MEEKFNLNRLIDMYFMNNNNTMMYRHLYESFDDLINIIPKITEENTMHRYMKEDILYIHKIKIKNIKIKLPCDEYDKEYITPDVARKRNLTYSITVYGDAYLETTQTDIKQDKIETFEKKVENIIIAKIPTMVKSKYCILDKMPENNKVECMIDPGGYFIVNGNEKVVVSLERQVSNKLLFLVKDNNFICTINSQKYEAISTIQSFSVILKNDNLFVQSNIFNQEIQLIVFLKALGCTCELDIFNNITQNLQDNNVNNIIKESIYKCKNEANKHITSQEDAIDYIFDKLSYTKNNTIISEKENEIKKKQLEKLYSNYILSHIENDIDVKINYICYMTNRLLHNYVLNKKIFYDRDNYENKRVDTPGLLIAQLFKQSWSKMMKDISLFFIKKNTNDDDPINVLNQIKSSYIEQFIKSSLLTGNWGISKNKKGVARILDRLSLMKVLSDLRKVNVSNVDETTKKLVSMRHVNVTQTGFICPVETPEGEKCGVVKSLAIQASVSNIDQMSKDTLKDFLLNNKNVIGIRQFDINDHRTYIKIIINGEWIAIVSDEYVIDLKKQILEMKLRQKIDKYTSIVLDIDNLELIINTECGRMVRPLLRVNENNELYLTKIAYDDLVENNLKFDEFMIKYPDTIEFIDVHQSLFSLISENIQTLNDHREIMNNSGKAQNNEFNKYQNSYNKFTHCEFHPSMILGICVSTIPFCSYNQAPRNVYHAVQIKQTIGIYSSAYKRRHDISNVLHDPQVPIVKPHMTKHIGLNDMPYGKNIMLAIMPMTGLTINNQQIRLQYM